MVCLLRCLISFLAEIIACHSSSVAVVDLRFNPRTFGLPAPARVPPRVGAFKMHLPKIQMFQSVIAGRQNQTFLLH
jgi:hypothetical protein